LQRARRKAIRFCLTGVEEVLVAEAKAATTDSEIAATEDDSGLALKAFKFGFVACIGLAMLGWLAFLGWLVGSLPGF
jgi:hypothetical protein